jgi:hypothetical protein
VHTTISLGLRKRTRNLLERPFIERVLREIEKFEGMSL